MTKAEAKETRQKWERAFKEIAREVGEKSELYKAMGSLAWGRYEYEAKVSGDGLENALCAVGYLRGARDALMLAAEVGKWRGHLDLRDIHQRIAEYR